MRWVTRRRALIFGAMILIAGSAWWFRSRRADQTGGGTYTVTRQTIQEVIVASGEVVADKQAVLKFPAAGKLGYIKVAEGDGVRKGQVLLGMDTADLASAQLEAHYKYLAADANAKEVEDSVKGHDKDETFVQKNDRVAAQTARDIAYDNWQEAQRDLRDAHLVSPIAGVVTDISVTAVGATVTITDGITVVDPTSVYFSLEVDEVDVGRVGVGQPVKVTLDAFAGEEFTGGVDRIAFASSLSDSGATVYPVKIRFTTAEAVKRLRLGMNGDAKIVLRQAEDVLALPLEAVSDGQVTLPDSKKQAVEVGIEGEDVVEIKSGLNEGDRVIVE